MPTRTRRMRQRGQVIPVAAIFSTALLGIMAVAVDLSLGSHRHRNLQNATDAAALVGARDLGHSNGGQPNQADRNQAVIDALRAVYDHMSWGSAGTTWATEVVEAQTGTNCHTGASATHCDVTTTGPGAAGAGVTVTVNVPPLTANNPAYDESQPGLPWGYVEVTVSERDASELGGVIGVTTETTAGHSVGYHFPGGQPFGFALYSNSYVSDGNQDEIVQGNVYAYRDILPQSSGHAAFCAGTDSTGAAGHIVLGAPQSGPFPVPDPAAGAPYQYQVRAVQNVASCTSISAGSVAQTAALGSCGTLTVQGMTLTATQDPLSLACMANPPLIVPDLQGPSMSGNVVNLDGSSLGSNASVLTVTTALAPGLYVVRHNPLCVAPACTDVVIDGHYALPTCVGANAAVYTTCLIGVTFWLDQGATIGITRGANVLITPYTPPLTQDPNDGRFPIYAPLGSPAGVYESNNGTSLTMTGTVYLPSGTMNVTQNALLSIDGQAITGTWTVQSGNFMNPEVTYDAHAVAAEREVLQLVE